MTKLNRATETRPAWDTRAVVIIPNYNQNQEFSKSLPQLLEYVPKEAVIFVDDGSSDGSETLARSYGLDVTQHEKNRGIGAAIRTGIQKAKQRSAEIVIIFSSNGKMNPAEIAKVVGPVLEGKSDYVTGSRFLAEGSHPDLPLFRKHAIRSFSKLASLLVLGKSFSDVTCGFRAYRISLLESMDLDQSWLDRYEFEYYVHYHCCRNGARIAEVPVTISYSHLSKDRRSKIVPIIGWWSILRPFIFLRLRIKR